MPLDEFVNTEEPVEEDTVDTSPINIPVPRTTAAIRAKKVTVGNPEMESRHQEIMSAIEQGNEPQVREDIAMQKQMKAVQQRQQLISEEQTRKGRPLNNQEIESIFSDTDRDYNADPYTVVEEYYSKAFLDELDRDPSSVFAQFKREDSEEANRLQRAGGTAAAQREVAIKLAQDMNDKISEQSWLSWGWDTAKIMFPFYYEGMMRGNTPDVGFFEGVIGSNLQAQADAILAKPYKEGMRELETIVNNLGEDNPQLGMAFALYVAGKSTSEVHIDNVLAIASGVAGVSSVPATIRGVKAIDRAIRARNAVKQVVKNAEKSEIENIDVLKPDATGDIAEAGVQKASSRLVQRLKGSTDVAKEAIENLMSVHRADGRNIKNNPGRMGEDIAIRLEQDALNSERNVINTILNTARVMRVPLEKLTPDVLRQIKNEISADYKSVDNSILNIGDPYYNRVTNTFHADIFFGRNTGELFRSFEEAQQFATRAGILDPKIVNDLGQYGQRFYIRIPKPINETSNILRDAVTELPSMKSPDSYAKGLLNWLRGSEDTLALEQRIQRKLATYGASNLQKMLKQEIESIKQLSHGVVDIDNQGRTFYPLYRLRGKRLSRKESSRRWMDWERAAKFSRIDKDPDTGKPGHFFENVGDLEDFYQRNIGRMPDGDEIRAYFAFKRVVEVDRVLRNLALFRNKSRVGAQNHRLFFLGEDGARVNTDYFDGVVKKEYPGGSEFDKVLLMGNTIGEEGVYAAAGIGGMNTKLLNRIKDQIKEGRLRVIEIYDPELRPFENLSRVVGNQRVRYVITPNLETRSLQYDQLPRRGGGHFDYDYDYYIKQAMIKPERHGSGKDTVFHHWYEGDLTVMPIQLRKMGSDVVNHLNAIQKLIKSGNLSEAEAYVNRHLADVGWDRIEDWFLKSKRLSLDEPFYVVPKGQMVVHQGDDLRLRYTKTTPEGKIKSTFKDGTRHGSLARQNQVEYSGERDAFDIFSLRNDGTAQNPLYKVEPAHMLDPIPSINRALNKIVNSHFMDDYKMFSVEQWLGEAAKHMDVEKSELRYSPMYFFHHPQYAPGLDANIKSTLESNRFKIQQLLGIPNGIDTFLMSGAQRLADSIYTKFGSKGLALLSQEALYKVKNFPAFARSITFHSKLGMFNPAQLLVQMQTYTVIHSIAGVQNSVPGTMAAFMHQLAGVNRNPEILKGLDDFAVKMKAFKKGEFSEASRLLAQTGFDNVGKEYAALDTAMSARVLTTRTGDVLDMAKFFFSTSERNVRLGAWFTAYKEFRRTNPFGRIGEVQRNEILNRADTLYVSMSRASQSIFNHSLLSWPAQFLSYQLRLAELFMGKRLAGTVQERALIRAKMVAWHSALYGVPATVGITGVPLGDFFRRDALENGYVVGDSWINDVAMGGLPNALQRLVTGVDLNIGERYSPGGVELLTNVINGDETIWKTFGGAPYSTLVGNWENSSGFRHAMMSMIRDDGEAFPPTVSDVVDVGREVSSWNNFARGAVAVSTGEWLSKHGTKLTDVSPAMGLLMSATGLQPQSVSDAFLLSGSYKDRRDLHRRGEKAFLQEFRKFAQEMDNGNFEQARKYMTRGSLLLKHSHYPVEDYARLVSRAARDNEDLVKKINWQFFTKHVGPEKKDQYFNTLRKVLQREGQ